MNELLVQSMEEKLDLYYEIIMPGHVKEELNECDIKVTYSDEISEEFEDDYIQIEFEENIDTAEKSDYLIAAACGSITGALSLLWGKQFNLDEAQKFGNDEADQIVVSSAKMFGCKKDDVEGAITFLEKRFPMAGDALTNDFGGGKQHHLRDFSHHASPVGLICSIIMQFTGEGIGTDTQGKIIHPKITKEGFVGKNFTEKILFGTVNWFFHLASDLDGSSSSVLNGTGKGTGIPGPILSLVKELSALPIFTSVDEDNINKPKLFSQYVSTLFNGTLIKNDEGEPIRFDLRTEMGIGNYVLEQAKPVLINECLVRACFFITHFIEELKTKNIRSMKELNKLDSSKILPGNNRILTRMITVSGGIFVTVNLSGTAVKAALHSKGDTARFCKEFFLSINYVGIGRFAFSCASDAEYIKEDISQIYQDYIDEKKGQRKKQFTLGYNFLTLNNEQTQILYSLKALAVDYDISNTKDQKKKTIKGIWKERWMKQTCESFKIEEDNYFMNESKVYADIYDIDAQGSNRGWLYLVTLELSLFQAYYNLSEEDGNLYSGLSYIGKYLEDVFVKGQMLILKDDVDSIEKNYKQYIGKLKENGKKAIIGVGVAVVSTVATGGIVLAFAPEIAVVLAGGSFAGLSGAALTSASLASIGGGSLAVGGLGMAGGTAILTGGGALLGMAGSGTAAFLSTIGKISEKFTLNECGKLLTYCKVVLVDKYDLKEYIEAIKDGISGCAFTIEQEKIAIEEAGTEEERKQLKRMKSCLVYLKNCYKELDLLQNEKGLKLENKAQLTDRKPNFSLPTRKK